MSRGVTVSVAVIAMGGYALLLLPPIYLMFLVGDTLLGDKRQQNALWAMFQMITPHTNDCINGDFLLFDVVASSLVCLAVTVSGLLVIDDPLFFRDPEEMAAKK